MTKTETVLRSIFGSCRSDIRPLAYAVDIAIELMFVQGIPMDDILVTNDIYPDVAKRIRKKSGAHPSAKSASRRIERLANKCWDAMVSRDLVWWSSTSARPWRISGHPGTSSSIWPFTPI